jgi:CheY-like chemotaxis protein
VILLDMCMPDMDGVELASRLRCDRELSNTPIILLSSGGPLNELEVSGAANVTRCLVKPVSRTELLDAIRAVVGSEPRTSVPAGAAIPDETRVGPAPAGGKLHVLVAEDNPVNQRVAVAFLQKLGHSVVVANTGREAVDAFARERFDLILMDVQMPEMGGFEATGIIRRSPGGTEVPIVAMTAHAMAGDEARCLQAGMDAYLTKPLDRKIFDEFLKQYSGASSRPVLADL